MQRRRILEALGPLSEPRYRLTYTRESATTLNGKFDVAPPGKLEAFAPYLSWTARRVK